MKLNKLFLIVTIAVSLVACKDDFDPGSVPGSELAGEWYVQTYVGGSAVLGHELISTYNTAAADGSQIWLDDQGHIWPVKAKINSDPAGMSFSGMGTNTEIEIFQYDTADMAAPYDSVTTTSLGFETINVLEGKVISDEGRSKTGVVTDSIYIRAEFSDDPGTEYEMSGHRRTGFGEDDY